MSKSKRMSVVLGLLLVLVTGVLIGATHAQEGDEGEPSEFHLRGTSVVRIGQYPDSFSYDGSDVEPLERPGFFELHLDATNDVGLMIGRFYVDQYQLNADTLLEDSQITVVYPLFGFNNDLEPEYWEGGITDFIPLHGDSGNEAPVLPAVWNDVASWGPAVVFIDGEQWQGGTNMVSETNPLGALYGHMMYTNLVRDPETGFVSNSTGDAPYSPMAPSDVVPFDMDAKMLHLVVRTDERDQNAFPPFTTFMHFNFLDVEEIEPLQDVEYLTWDEALNDLTPEDIQGLFDQWLALADEIEATITEADA